jgi:hypothetical protein
MGWWTNAVQYATEALAIVLILRLLSLRNRHQRVYIVFSLFLAIELLSTAVYFVSIQWWSGVDYRLLWICSTFVLWLFSLAVVYSLAQAILAELPGILRFSRRLLNTIFPLALVIALSTVWSEYLATGGAKWADPIDRLLIVWYSVDRAISMAALVVLVAILAFILWFPVKMSRNLAIFSIGFGIYFASKTGLALLRTHAAQGVLSVSTISVLSTCVNLVLVLCFTYWIIFIDLKGQTAQVRLGHIWRPTDQGSLIEQLESLDLALLRSSRRLEL